MKKKDEEIITATERLHRQIPKSALPKLKGIIQITTGKMKKKHYPDCEINNGGKCDCGGDYNPKRNEKEKLIWLLLTSGKLELPTDRKLYLFDQLCRIIDQACQQAREEFVKEIRLEKKDGSQPATILDVEPFYLAGGYNQAIFDLNQKIKKYLTKEKEGI